MLPLIVVTHFFSGVFWLSELLRTAFVGLPGVGVASPGRGLLLLVDVELLRPFSRVGDFTSNTSVSDSMSESICLVAG